MKKVLMFVPPALLILALTLSFPQPVPAAANQPTGAQVNQVTPPFTDWSAAKDAYTRWLNTGTATVSEKELITEYLRAAGGNRESSNPLDNSGGPDAFGYRFADNSSPDTATYDWIELRGMAGTVWINDFSSPDDGTSTIPLGLNFPFYGGVYSNVTVCTNGFLEFSTNFSFFTNGCLPTSNIDGPVIFPFWDDLHLENGGIGSGQDVVGYRQFNNYTVIEYDSIGRFNGAGSYKFEALLFADGRIKIQFNQAGGGDVSSNTIGIQAAGSGPSLQYRCDADGFYVGIGRAVWFWGPSGLSHDFVCSNVISPMPGQVNPGQSINVSAEITNFGTSTEASPVKYQLDNGSVVSEMTGSLAIGGIETHAFATPLVMPTQNGRYILKVWTDLATDENRSNDTVYVALHVGCADFAVTAPGAWTGSTCNESDDCDLRLTVDVTYAITIPESGHHWKFTTCDESTNFDTYLYLTDACCGGTTLAFNDDDCAIGGHGLNSTIGPMELDAGTYYLDVESFSSPQCGNYTLIVEQTPPCIDCQGGDLIEIPENPADTTFYRTDPNGGCNSDPDRFMSISVGQMVCGLGFFYDGPGGNPYRDTDWYSFSLAQTETVTVAYWADFPQQVAIVDYSDCNSPQIIMNASTDNVCSYQYAFANCPAGNYALFFAPTFGSDQFSVSDSMHYRVRMYHGTLSASEPETSVPSDFKLFANYPNPFNPTTVIGFALPRAADVELSVYDINGRLVSVLARQMYEAGTHEVRFDGANLPSGLYFARLHAGDFNATQKMMLLK